MNRIRLLALLPILCLPACNNSSFYGNYSFGLGKTDGSHFGINVNLSKEDYPSKEGMKKMTISAEFGDEYSIGSMIESYKEQYPIIEVIFDTLLKDVDNISDIDCYYKVTNQKTKDGNRVEIGSEELTELLKKSNPDFVDTIETYIDLDLNPSITRYFFSAYVNKKEFSLQIPVSLADVQQQLVWYGRYLDMDNPDSMYKELDLEGLGLGKLEDRFGTHPEIKKDKKGNVISDPIQTINEAYKYQFSYTCLYDEYSLVLGKFIQGKNDNGEKVLYFYPKDDTVNLNNLEGTIKTMGLLGDYDEEEIIKFTTNPETHETNVTYNHEKGTKEGFTDEKGKTFTFNKFMQPPFVFRDYHDVMIGLKKQ